MSKKNQSPEIKFSSDSEKMFEQLKYLATKAYEVRIDVEINEMPPTEEQLKTIDNFDDCFRKLQLQSIDDNFFWKFCPFQVYTNNFDRRLSDFSRIVVDCNLFDFVCEEIKVLCNLDEYHKTYLKEDILRFKEYFLRSISYWLETDRPYGVTLYSKPEIETSQSKKIEYLLELVNNEKVENNLSKTEEDFFDYSDSSDPEKFVMLHELGIIDYLKSKISVGYSEKKLAALISTFTSIDKENLRKMINGSKNKDHNNKINQNSLDIFDRKLRELKIDSSFFNKKN